MKARVIATGEIVEVMYSHTLYDIIWYITPRGACFSEEELELIDTGESLDYWTRLEHQYAGMAMQALIIDASYAGNEGSKYLVEECTTIAHALVEKYKKEERK